MHRRGLSALVLCTTTATVLAGLPAVPGQAATPRVTTTSTAATAAARQQPVTITLITGDRVTLHSGDQISVTPGPGRAGTRFLSPRLNGHRYVIPADALPLLKDDRIDRRLFDVTALRGFGYDDRSRELPLLVTSAKGSAPLAKRQGAARTAVTADGVRVVRDLPAADALAVRADRSGRAALWGSLTGGAPAARSLRAGVAKIWLDGKRTISLDVSVPQIGAPAAWKAGFDGTGVKVAVLDTGIDATHPDLAGRIEASANFTDAPDTDDNVGHGTHVASTIAGSGAASGGRYRGVAPGAKLLNGKVCADEGCEESAIIAGMQWAVQQGAQVVNLSLGGQDSPDIDPLEQAVNDLTASSGALFVIAAGNDGADASVGSPASADAALAVGAVDSHDQLAEFSSRGPRVGDDALKPDITAPGVNIVAAKAAHGQIGDPAPVAGYVSLSGTSMATPHVAGAAAILTQQHPTWSAAQRKSGLMASAKPTAGLGVFGQGAGRVDVARAITQTVTVDAPSVSFGRQVWPHGDDPTIVKTVTYRNSGTAAVTLALATTATGPTGAAAPAGVFTLGANSLTVPAGGTATVTLTANTRVDGPDGAYGGYLTATAAGGVQVQTPFGVNREVESYDVTLAHTNRDGTPALGFFTVLLNLDNGALITAGGDSSSVTVRLPKGRYGLFSSISTDGNTPDDPSDDITTILTQPEFAVGADTTLKLDARKGKPLSVTVPSKDARSLFAALQEDWSDANFGVNIATFADRFDNLFSAQVLPAAPAEGFTSSVAAAFARPSADGTFGASPYIYDLMWFSEGTMLSGLRRAVQNGDLATIHARYDQQIEGGQGAGVKFGMPPGVTSAVGAGVVTDLPFQRTEYANTDSGLVWNTESDIYAAGSADDGPQLVSINFRDNVRYRARHSYDAHWNAAVIGPSVASSPGLPILWAARQGDTIVGAVPLYGDGQGNYGFSATTAARTALYRNGTLVGESADTFGEFTVPAGRATYRLEQSADRGAPHVLSTRVQAAWTFTSQHIAGEQAQGLPVSIVRFSPRLNRSNTAPTNTTFHVGVSVDPMAGSSAAANRTLKVQVSYDDGRTWTNAVVKGQGADRVVVVRHPNAAGFASLRATATDTAGNTVTQTVIRAYRIG